MPKKKVNDDALNELLGERGEVDKRTLRRKPNLKPATYKLSKDLIQRVKNYSYWGRKEQSEIVREALEEYLQDKKTDEPD